MKTRVFGILLAMLSAASVPTNAAADIIADWNFSNYPTGTSSTTTPGLNTPAAAIGVNAASATAQTLGMTNNYTYNGGEGPGSSGPFTDIVAGNAGGDNTWRIRGPSNSSGGGAGQSNGWNSQAPQYTQGAQFNVPTTGYTNLTLSFGWLATSQGVGDLMVRQSSDGGVTWTNALSTPLEMTPANVNVTVQTFSNIALADGTNAVELVSAYNPTFGNYASATSDAAGSPVVLNNSSGNWRFTDIDITGTAAVPEPSSFVLLGLTCGVLTCCYFVRRRRSKAEALTTLGS